METHDGTSYQPQAEMVYNGLGQRLALTAHQGGQSLTTQYLLDGNTLLAATADEATTFYLPGVGEYKETWGYYLADGTNSVRQITNVQGVVTLTRSFTPWGELLALSGTGDFTWGYLGGVLDAATGLVYMGNGQYYDPATGRFLSRGVNPGAPNPYVPWQGNPAGMIVGPLALLALIRGKRKAGKIDRFMVVVIVALAVSLTISSCTGGGNGGTPTQPPLTPPTGTPEPKPASTPTNQPTGTGTPTESPKPPIDCDLSTPTPTPTPPPIFGLDDPLRYFSEPDGLTNDGRIAYKSIMAMIIGDATKGLQKAWWFTMGVDEAGHQNAGDGALTLRELLAIVTNGEVGSEMYQTAWDETKIPIAFALPDVLVNALTYKFNDHCSEGAFSAGCFNGFWGYYEPIRAVASSASARNILLVKGNIYSLPPWYRGNKGRSILAYSEQIIQRESLGGENDEVVSDWVTLKQEVNKKSFEYNWQATYSRTYGEENYMRKFLAMTPVEWRANCAMVGLTGKCNLTKAP